MERLLVGEARCRGSQARYYLLEEGTSYGVEIRLEGESAAVRNLSPSRERAGELARRLVRGAVTPVGLRDVVDDWLLE